MQFIYPIRHEKPEFSTLEVQGMQALAVGATKQAKMYYDRAILSDPCLQTICRIVDQYTAAGLRSSTDGSAYFRLSHYREWLDDGQDKYGNFSHVLNMMRKEHGKYLKEQHQGVVARAQKQDAVSRTPPRHQDNMTEWSPLVKDGEPNA